MKAETIGPPPWKARIKRTLKQIGPIRLAGTIVFLLLGLAFARYGWAIPLANDAERALYDMRWDGVAPRSSSSRPSPPSPGDSKTGPPR